jgi:lipoprotein signal peptidase
MLFWIGGGYVRAAAIAIISVVSGAVGNKINPFFPAGVVPEFLEFL